MHIKHYNQAIFEFQWRAIEWCWNGIWDTFILHLNWSVSGLEQRQTTVKNQNGITINCFALLSFSELFIQMCLH